MDTKSVFIQILTIIEFEENKEKFADDFIRLCLQQAFVELLMHVPVDIRKQFQDKVIQHKDIAEIASLLRPYIHLPEIEKKVQATTTNLLTDYIRTISPTLDKTKQKRLWDCITNLDQNQE